MANRITLLLLFISLTAFAQNRNSNWCFGDSAGVFFNGSSTTLFTSAIKSRGSAISVSDSTGQLLFYSYTRVTVSGKTTLVKNKNHQLMQNGNDIIGEGWYQELVSIPAPGNSNQYYLFSTGVTGGGGQTGLYYSLIDMTLDGGLGGVTLKNIALQNYYADDCVQAIKHGNGRDWWIINRRWQAFTDEFYEFLITPQGITGPTIFHLGSAVNSGFYRLTFSRSGNKMIGVTTQGLIELFDFDRCTGTLNFVQNIHPQITSGNIPNYWGAAFSPNERYLYISGFPDPTAENYLFQFDLLAANIYGSIDTLWYYPQSVDGIGHLKLAPDGKIYLAMAWYDGVNFNYPYPDTTFNVVNNNLSVINYPDSAGVACDFQPFSFNLGTGRCYWGLPNNPDYEMGAIPPCDSLTTVDEFSSIVNSELFIFYHPTWHIAFINAKDLKGKSYVLSVFDLMGKEIYREEDKVDKYFTKDLNCSEFANGMYIVTLQTEKEKLVKRFVKE
jgi:hypothetical protein